MRRNLSALAASILNGSLLSSAWEPPHPSWAKVADEEHRGQVRRNSDAPRLTDNATSQPHRPRGHGA
jgi:hypothetical protein